MRATLLTAVVLLLISASGAAHAGSGGERGPFCPERLELKAGALLDTGRLEGKSLRRAREIARRNGCTIRIVRLDGAWLSVTQDYVTNRINVAVRDGIVKRVVSIG
jgi:hypothetical protein